MKRIGLLVLFMVLIVGLTGCSGGSSGIRKSSDNTLSGSFSPKTDSIWYLVDSGDTVGKDSDVRTVFVFKDGESFVYPYDVVKKISLGELSQKEDAEIITMLEELEKQLENECRERIKSAKVGCDVLISSGIFDSPIDSYRDTYDFTSDKSTVVEFSKSLDNVNFVKEPTEIKYAVYTDSTGNVVDKELISYKSSVFDKINPFYDSFAKFSIGSEASNPNNVCVSMWRNFNMTRTTNTGGLGNLDKSDGTGFNKDFLKNGMTTINSFYPVKTGTIVVTNALDPARGAIQVYDNTYSGFIAEDKRLLLTKVDGSSFVMDDINKDGVVVDPESADLFKE